MEQSNKEHNYFLLLIATSLLVIVASAFYSLYYKKEYKFLVETPCDPTLEECIQRDCEEEADCPPNQLTDFKRYEINAKDFKYCENENCANACENNKIECVQLECEENPLYGEICISPEGITFEKESNEENTETENIPADTENLN